MWHIVAEVLFSVLRPGYVECRRFAAFMERLRLKVYGEVGERMVP